MRPGEQAELAHVVALHQRQHEPHEAHAVKTERDEPVVRHQEVQVVLGNKGLLSNPDDLLTFVLKYNNLCYMKLRFFS